ncbi:MAG: HhH-GPD-type base excision DNA repair protein [Jatrophihabitans sp.]
MYLATTDAANDLLERDPLALLMGMLLDQQIPMEKAFTSPAVLAERMGGRLDAAVIAGTDPDDLEALFRERPALHRFPAAMAKRVQELCRIIVDQYDGDAARVWSGVTSGKELRERIDALPGFGEQKAKIFVALLGKQSGVQPKGWRQAAGDYGTAGYKSVADVTDATSLVKVRAYKQQMKAAAKASAG